ncbi:hypothetical protein GCM10028805_13740 [Spirosoma harenae]
MGVYYLRKPISLPTDSQQETNPFKLGFLLSLLNLAAFPFWTIYTILLLQKGWVNLMSSSGMLIYVTEISLGTLLGLWVFVSG